MTIEGLIAWAEALSTECEKMAAQLHMLVIQARQVQQALARQQKPETKS